MVALALAVAEVLPQHPEQFGLAHDTTARALCDDGTAYAVRGGALVAADDTVVALLDAGLEHRGLVVAGDTVFVTEYARSRFGAHDGAVLAIPRAGGTPSTVIDGFHEPVAIAALGRDLVVADARARAIYRIELVAGRGVARYQIATLLDRPTALAVAGDTILVASYDAATGTGEIRELRRDGSAPVIASGSWQPTSLRADTDRVYVVAAGVGTLTFTR